MAKENKHDEKKTIAHAHQHDEKHDHNQESKIEEKKVESKPLEQKIVKKDVARAMASSLRVSPKKCMAIGRVIKGKSPLVAIKRLEDVLTMKRVIPMAGREVPHKKGTGIAGGRFPLNACRDMINLLKQVNANATVNGIDNPIITLAVANFGSRPFRRGGTRGKRTHMVIEVRDKKSLVEKK